MTHALVTCAPLAAVLRSRGVREVEGATRRAEPATSDVADGELVKAALAGDRRATEDLVGRLARVIQVRVGVALLRRRHAARGRTLAQEVEDLMQEVFAALFEQDGRVLRRWDPARGLSLKSYVGLVAEREAG